MRNLLPEEIAQVDGAGPLANAATGLGVAAAVGGGLACIPTPASPALAGFAVVAAVLGGALAWADTKIVTSTKAQ